MLPNDYPPLEVDTVMIEVRRVKTLLAERYQCDLKAMFRAARARQGHSGHKVVDLSRPAAERAAQ